jgi:hypothetical protein
MSSPVLPIERFGTFLYAGSVECDIRVVRSSTRFGSGDYEDPPDLRDDVEIETFYIEYGSTTDRGVFNAGGGAYSSLAEAIAAAEASLGPSARLRWANEA